MQHDLRAPWVAIVSLPVGGRAPAQRKYIGDGKDIIVRVHSQCLTGDVLHSIRCDCGAQLEAAIERIAREGRGVLLYLNQEGR